MTTSIVTSEDVTPRCSLHMQTQEIMVRNPSCSPVHRRNKLFSTCSEKSVWQDRQMEMWKSVPCLLGRWTLWLRQRFLPPSLPPSLRACVLGSSSEMLLLWKVLFTARRRDLSASQIQFYGRLWVRVEPAHWTLCFRRKWCWWQPVLLSRGVAVFLFQLILLAGVWLHS